MAGRVDSRIEALYKRVTLDLLLDGVRGAQRPVLAVFILLFGVACNHLGFMILCVLNSFLVDPITLPSSI